MTDTMKTELRREAFERAMCERGYHDFRWYPMQEKFVNIFTQGQWEGWCAALDSQAAQAQPSVEVRVGELRASNGTTYTVTLYHHGEVFGEGMCVFNTSKKGDAEFDAQVWRDWLTDAGLAASPSPNDPPSEGVNHLPGSGGSNGNGETK